MFKSGDLVGLFIINDWGNHVLSDLRGVVLNSNSPQGIALVCWTDGHQRVHDWINLKLIAYGRTNRNHLKKNMLAIFS
mgnify:CR=1 FL=1|jgi:hypothetical protein